MAARSPTSHPPAAYAAGTNDPAPPLYEQLRHRLYTEILDGTYPDGSFLPTEAELVTQLRLSRVTVRRALQALKDDGVITSVAGRGTQVSFQSRGHAGALTIITLVADIDNGFFTHFMQRFEPVAEARGTLVMLKTGRAGSTFTSDALFQKLIRGGLRDLVLWPLTSDLDPVLYARLRAVGANLVVFDQELHVPWADTVCLDNAAAMASLVDVLAGQGCQRIVFVDDSKFLTPTAATRRAGFKQAALERGLAVQFAGMPFEGDQPEPGAAARELVAQLERSDTPPDGYVGVNGGIGLALALALGGVTAPADRPRGGKPPRRPVACVDFLPGMAGLGMPIIDQPIDALAEKVYACLQTQHRKGSRWKAAQHTLPGTLRVT